jgi:hypothetical protein
VASLKFIILALVRIIIHSFIVLTTVIKIINYDYTVSMIVNYDCKTFIVQATGGDMAPDILSDFYLVKNFKIVNY